MRQQEGILPRIAEILSIPGGRHFTAQAIPFPQPGPPWDTNRRGLKPLGSQQEGTQTLGVQAQKQDGQAPGIQRGGESAPWDPKKKGGGAQQNLYFGAKHRAWVIFWVLVVT